MAKGQIRQAREKKKPKADKGSKPKQLSAYKQAQMQGSPGGGHVVVAAPGKKA